MSDNLEFIIKYTAMNLHVSLSKPGHYAKNAARVITKPINAAIALATLATIISTSELKAQNNGWETIYGTGIFSAYNVENNSPISDVSLYLRPESIAMITPDTTYQFTTDGNGWVEFSLPVYVDSTTGIEHITKDKTYVLPNFGSELNAFFPKTEKGTIEMYSINGQLVKKEDFNTDHEYLQFNDLATGLYVYSIRTESGILHSGKFLKQNTSPKGPSARPNIESSNFKNTQITHTATYWMKWEHPDFYTDSTLITLEEGDNGFIGVPMTSNIIPIPQHQDISGIVTDMNNNYAPIQGAIIEVEVPGMGTISTSPASDGSFIINNLPLNTNIVFNVGGIEGKYSFTDIPYTTIDEVVNPQDTINNNFNVVLPDKISTTSAHHIVQQTSHGTRQDTIKYYLGNTFNAIEKENLRNHFNQLQAEEDNVYIFAESSTQLNNTGINIQSGTYNTSTDNEAINTPLGDILYPVLCATSSMSASANYHYQFVHEIKRALGFHEVAWTSVMQALVQNYTLEDKDIARNMERPYWNAVYKDNKTWIDLNYLEEDLSGSKSTTQTNNKTSTNSGNIQVNYSGK